MIKYSTYLTCSGCSENLCWKIWGAMFTCLFILPMNPSMVVFILLMIVSPITFSIISSIMFIIGFTLLRIVIRSLLYLHGIPKCLHIKTWHLHCELPGNTVLILQALTLPFGWPIEWSSWVLLATVFKQPSEWPSWAILDIAVQLIVMSGGALWVSDNAIRATSRMVILSAASNRPSWASLMSASNWQSYYVVLPLAFVQPSWVGLTLPFDWLGLSEWLS